jgi:hypothetical protein
VVSGQPDGQKSDISLKRKLCVMMSYVAVILLASSLVLDVTKGDDQHSADNISTKEKVGLDMRCCVEFVLGDLSAYRAKLRLLKNRDELEEADTACSTSFCHIATDLP